MLGLLYLNFIIFLSQRFVCAHIHTAIPFPKTFLQSIKVMFTRMFRIFAIVYCNHFSKLESVGATSHLNTSFKVYISQIIVHSSVLFF